MSLFSRFSVIMNELEFLEMKLSQNPAYHDFALVQFSEARMRLLNESLVFDLQENMFIGAVITLKSRDQRVVHHRDTIFENIQSLSF